MRFHALFSSPLQSPGGRVLESTFMSCPVDSASVAQWKDLVNQMDRCLSKTIGTEGEFFFRWRNIVERYELDVWSELWRWKRGFLARQTAHYAFNGTETNYFLLKRSKGQVILRHYVSTARLLSTSGIWWVERPSSLALVLDSIARGHEELDDSTLIPATFDGKCHLFGSIRDFDRRPLILLKMGRKRGRHALKIPTQTSTIDQMAPSTSNPTSAC